MATTDGTLALGPGADAPVRPMGVFARPGNTPGWRGWVTTVDHKRIGIMYGAAALFFFLIGGVEAMLIRLQLAAPEGKVLSADLYNQVYTMHGTTMIFLVVMPIGASFMNYLLPLQIGARDVAFPRLNALSFWVFLAGGIVLNSAWLLGGGADGGWFNYAPNNGVLFSPTHGIDFWNMGLIITGISSLLGAVNLITTVLNMRAPGMTLMRMPVFTWMSLVTQFMLLFAIPVLTSAQFLLLFDRLFGARFFDVSQGADPLLWQHLFWIFGHPEVYIMILPAFGVISEMIPVFSRKPIFGYPFMVFSGIAIGFMGWGVWAHHMFASGLGPISVAAFATATMFIAVPTGVKILNWMATMWGGKLRFDTPLLYSVGLVTMFTIGGLSGVTHAVAPADTQQTDTYYIVAHFHYVLFGGALFGFVGAWYFWWPKAFGYKLSEFHGKVNFWILLIGFNLTFGPMHILGLQGMPRRTYTYRDGYGFNFWNLVATIGAATIGISFLYFFWIIWSSWRKAKVNQVAMPADPWDARGIEWMIPCPAPAHNYDVIPTVRSLDDFWHRKYGEDENGNLVRIAATEDIVQKGDATDVHLPSPS
ncbi:MAG: cytochrome c oxidase subunit I, partial [Microthrixaceae bacterium]|nr:cytochrome c oxidase subunit I [Microthrixaceae bacterium]